MERIQDSLFYGIGIDENTDVSLNKNLVVYTRYLAYWVPRTEFLGMIKVTDGKAETVQIATTSYLFDELGLDPKKMITFGSDGASVMTGAIGGVVALIIMRFCAFMVAVHCICHRLALASADAADAMDFSDKWEKLMNTTFSFFSRSTDRTQAWNAVALSVTGRWSKLVHSCKTRWLSRSGAVQSMVEQMLTLIAYFLTFSQKQLEEDNNAAFILGQLTSFHVLLMLHYLADVLGALNRLSLHFQHHNVDLTDVTKRINLFLEQMARCYGTTAENCTTWGKSAAHEYGGTYLRRFIRGTMEDPAIAAGSGANAGSEANAGGARAEAEAEPNADGAEAEAESNTEVLYGGNKITVNATAVQAVVRVIGEFSQQIHLRVAERFPRNKLLAALEIVNPANIEGGTDLNSYGEESLDILVEAFGTPRDLSDPEYDSNGKVKGPGAPKELVEPLLDGDALRAEFDDLKE